MRISVALVSILLNLSSVARAASGLDINDVAVLFPNNGQHKPVPYLSLDNAELVSSSVMRTVLAEAIAIGIGPPQTSPIDQPADWSVRAFRVDPCAPEEHGKSIEPCLYELRLIAQPTARFSPADSSLHLIYKIASGKPQADDPMLKALLKLKTEAERLSGLSSSGQPLGVHPILGPAVKGKRSDIPALFAEFLQTHARHSKLSHLTMMGLRGGSPTDWIFFGGDIVDGKWVRKAIPNQQKTQSRLHFVELNVTAGPESFKGIALDPKLSLAPFFNQTIEENTLQLDALAESAFTLENPALSDRNNADCVSCHTATSARLSTDYTFPTSLPGVSAKSPVGITAFPALGTVQNHPLHWNLRAFGYFGLVPTVSMRTVHEAADSAAQLNAILGLKAPGPDCSSVSEAVMQCLISGTLEPGTVKDSATCMSLCDNSASPLSEESQPRP